MTSAFSSSALSTPHPKIRLILCVLNEWAWVSPLAGSLPWLSHPGSGALLCTPAQHFNNLFTCLMPPTKLWPLCGWGKHLLPVFLERQNLRYRLNVHKLFKNNYIIHELNKYLSRYLLRTMHCSLCWNAEVKWPKQTNRIPCPQHRICCGKGLREFGRAGNYVLYHARVWMAWIHPLDKIIELRSVHFNMQI